ncbi:MAG: ethanolamine utilization protein EutH [Ruminococcaceae bacterium]|nr:ethanolamine utilization protein EutH [Oscillospiraceae bacterium]
MNYISLVMAVFAVIAAIDRIFGNRLKLGLEFERGLMMLGPLALSMIGMIVISPLISHVLQPFLGFISEHVPVDPSSVIAIIFANDMGGAHLCVEMANDAKIGLLNAMVVSAMMGATVSYTIPVSLGMVKKEQHREMTIGLLCGIVTIPIGCFAGGIMQGIPFIPLLINLLPLIIVSALIAIGLIKIPDTCVRIFNVFGVFIKILITAGLAAGIFEMLTGITLIPYTAPISEGADIVFNAAVVMTGAFPMIKILSALLSKPLSFLAKKAHINETSATGIVSSMASSLITFDLIKDMDRKGVVLNAAFAVSGAFTFAGHLAFTLAFEASYLPCVITSKLIAGFTAVVIAFPVYKIIYKDKGI